MPKLLLTDLAVRKLKAVPEKQISYFDAKQAGLILRVNWNGTKSWRVLFYVEGKNRTHGIGYFDPSSPAHVNVKQARVLAGDFKAKLPEFLKAEKSISAAGTSGTYDFIAENFLKRYVAEKGLRSSRQIEALLGHVKSVWTGRLFAEIDRDDVTQLLDQIQDTRGPRAADVTLAVVRKMMSWHQTRTSKYRSPIVPNMNRSTPSKQERDRYFSDAELRVLWRCCDELPHFGPMVKFLVLSGQRRSKVATMRFDDIVDGFMDPKTEELFDGVWVIHFEDENEKGTGGALKLSPALLAIIEKQRALRVNEFVFPASGVGRRNGPGKHFGSFSAFGQGKAELDKQMRESLPDLLQWQLHDCRRTAVSLLQRCPVSVPVSEALWGHVVEGVRGVYARYQYFKEKGEALIELSNVVERIINPPAANVVSIKKR